MSIERALIAKARQSLITGNLQRTLQCEASKGCTPDLHSCSVGLEPPYVPIGDLAGASAVAVLSQCTGSSSGSLIAPRRLSIWIHPDYDLNWLKAEQFLKILASLRGRAGFEIVGNRDSILFSLLAGVEDASLFQAAFRSQYPQCELTDLDEDVPARLHQPCRDGLLLADYYPDPPYSHLFTQPDELRISPLETALTALAAIPETSTGLIQFLFQPVAADHDWHQNINTLLDLEYAIKLINGLQPSQRISSQPPSGELHGMAKDMRIKAHNDKPIFVASLRVAVSAPEEDLENGLQLLNLFTNLFQHGGRHLKKIGMEQYLKVVGFDDIWRMLEHGLVHRHGFILNSSELAAMIHLPPIGPSELTRPLIQLVEPLAASSPDLLSGTPIGNCDNLGVEQTVCIPDKIRTRSTHLIARQGMGKSTLMERMVLHDIDQGHGVAVLDPHGDLITRLTHLIPPSHVHRTILMEFDDPNWIPLWNPIHTNPGQDLSRTADDIVAAIKNIVQGWGDRLENLLRHAVFALLHLPEATLLDISNLLRKGSDESKILIKEILETVDNQTSRLFWKHDFSKYTAADLNPPKHKLSKLLLSGNVSLMLSQPENRIDFRHIMDEGGILLMNLSGIGSETRALLGSFALSLLHIATLSRSDIPIAQRKPFHIHCDEAHRFLTASIEDIIVEARKFGVSMTLAHQYLRQFDQAARDGILTSGTTVIFNVDMNDSRYLVKDLQGKVRPEELATFGVGDAIARIGTDIVRIKTSDQAPIPTNSQRDAIVSHSRNGHYTTATNIRLKPTDRIVGTGCSFPPNISSAPGAGTGSEFEYDEFE